MEKKSTAELEALRKAVLDYLVSEESEVLEEDSVAAEGLRAFVRLVPEVVAGRRMVTKIERVRDEFLTTAGSLEEVGGAAAGVRARVYRRISRMLGDVVKGE